MEPETKQKLLSLYESGRFECDIWFHEHIIELIEKLEIFEYLSEAKNGYTRVKKIYNLTEENSQLSLSEDFDEDSVLENSKLIKDLISELNTTHINQLMIRAKNLNFIDFSHHIAQIIAKYNFHPLYKEIFERIYNGVHDRKIRLTQELTCLLFMYKNKEKGSDILPLYIKALERSLIIVKEFRQKLAVIKEQKDTCSLVNNKKVIVYCFGVFEILSVSLKISELVKILDGKNTYLLKLSTHKSEVQDAILLWPELAKKHKELQSKKSEVEMFPFEELKDLIAGDQKKINSIKNTCKICLRRISSSQLNNEEGSSSSTSSTESHLLCTLVLRKLLEEKSSSLEKQNTS